MATPLAALCYRLDIVEKKTVEGHATFRATQALVRDLGEAEEKHAKMHQKLLDAVKSLPHMTENVTQLYQVWHTELVTYVRNIMTAKQLAASELLGSIVPSLQLHLGECQAQTRQVLVDIRTSHDLYVSKKGHLVTVKHRYTKAAKAAEALLDQREASNTKLESDIAGRASLSDAATPSLASLQQRKHDVLNAIEARLSKSLSDVREAQTVYATAHADVLCNRDAHRLLILTKLAELHHIEEHRVECLQGKVLGPFAKVYVKLARSLSLAADTFFVDVRQGLESSMSMPTFENTPGDGSSDASVASLTSVATQMRNDGDVTAKLAEIFQLLQTLHEAHAKRLQQLLSANWTLGPLEGPSVHKAWDQALASLEIAAHAHSDYGNALRCNIAPLWAAMCAAQASTKRQIVNMVNDTQMKRIGVRNNQRDACSRYEMMIREVDARLRQIKSAEREASTEAQLPQRDRFVVLTWRDPASVRLEKLQKSLQEFQETEVATATKQQAFAKEASEMFAKIYDVLVSTVHGDFQNAKTVEWGALISILTVWEDVLGAFTRTLDRSLEDVVVQVRAVSYDADVLAFVAEHAVLPPPGVVHGTPMELYYSPRLTAVIDPPSVPLIAATTSVINSWPLKRDPQQVEAAIFFVLCMGTIVLYWSMGLVETQVRLAHALVLELAEPVATLCQYLETGTN
ncbi:hypothetical protein SDRG_03306 [Saprolegnia diclina VS20]|uniref:FCH domain-containing protein n=1 Tax=Saprolegnia diclina (strain VS20) TaxID=1156394 RepID=T0S2D2_SAPDV|nr:hypothetical protein SDRG_03306 [Saprolegnia diclina VS20]EQC39098.1 hypothetical protein SDRG_03306 [Saprolegnia diclina VS20]|eukprot:XP_008607159.1 hypothetical protein SDRG_03306 [Saprolegnia diclina VS20]